MSVLGVLDHRFRGFRIIEIGGVGVLLALILLVYLAKTIAGGQSAQIDRVQQQIASEKARVTLLRAEVASLEQPERLEALSGRYLNLQPVDAKHEIDPQALSTIAHADAPPASSQPASTTPAVATTQTPTPTPSAATPAPPAAVVVAANPATAKPKQSKPLAAKPVKLAAAHPAAKPARLAVARPAAVRPTKLAAAATQSDEAASAAAESGDTRPASELKPPALDPIGSLVAQSAGSSGQ